MLLTNLKLVFRSVIAKLMVYSVSDSPALLRLALLLVLEGKLDELFLLSGVKCSSWVQINSGTSRRSYSNPMGDPTQESVRIANAMVSRSH